MDSSFYILCYCFVDRRSSIIDFGSLDYCKSFLDSHPANDLYSYSIVKFHNHCMIYVD